MGPADHSCSILSPMSWHTAIPTIKAWWKEVGARGKRGKPLEPISIRASLTHGKEFLASGSLFSSIGKKKLESCGDAWRQW
jgi:hypothetical protein